MLGIKTGKLLFATSLVLCSLFACNVAPSMEIDCEDGIDDDQNGLVDCEDLVCLNTFECFAQAVPMPLEARNLTARLILGKF